MPKPNEITRREFARLASAAVASSTLPNRLVGGVETEEGEKMTNLTPYLLFDGTCLQAMEFYRSCFGGELTLAKVKDTPAKDHLPPNQHDKVINARLKSGKLEISASDWLRPNQTPEPGNMVCLYLNGGTKQQLKSMFQMLSQEAVVTDPLKDEFFGTYGALNDRFGVRWMFHTYVND